MFQWLFNKKAASTVTLEEQLQQLQEMGITLQPGVSINHLIEHMPMENFESAPYDQLLLEMGCTAEIEGEEIRISNCVWYEDTEIVEDHGSYVEILQQLQRISGLEIQQIEDYVDIEEQEAWVSFSYQNERMKWTIQVDDDWLDLNVLIKFDVLIQQELGKRLVWADCYGQYILVLCLTDKQLQEVNQIVQHKFSPIN